MEDQSISQSKCACLVDAQSNTPEMRRRVSYLMKYSEVVSVADQEQARRQLQRMGMPLLDA